MNDIEDEIRENMTARNIRLAEIYRLLKSVIVEMQKKEGRNNTPLNDNEILAVIKSEVRSRQKSIVEIEENLKKTNKERTEAINEFIKNANFEIGILNEFLPAEISKEDAIKIVGEILTETNAWEMKNSGQRMGVVMKTLKAKGISIDGSVVKDIIEMITDIKPA